MSTPRTLLVATALFIGCDDPKPEGAGWREHERKTAMTITYMRDERTGLCFAGRGLWTNTAIFTSVPCTPKVLELIEDKGEP